MIMCVFLFALWLLLNGRVTVEVCLFGVVIAGAVYAFCLYALGYHPSHEKRLLKRLGGYVVYVAMLIWEIIKANLVVARCILNRRIPLQKTLATVEVDLKTELARMVLANSITLTPGTITVKVEGNRFTIHCLSRELLDGIEESTWVRLLRKMEG